jgi:hypothetical protein
MMFTTQRARAAVCLSALVLVELVATGVAQQGGLRARQLSGQTDSASARGLDEQKQAVAPAQGIIASAQDPDEPKQAVAPAQGISRGSMPLTLTPRGMVVGMLVVEGAATAVIVDTGSSLSWVFAADDSSSGSGGSGRSSSDRPNAQSSSEQGKADTWPEPSFAVAYVTGSVEGTIRSEQISIAGYSSQFDHMGVVPVSSDPIDLGSHARGILGVSPNSMSGSLLSALATQVPEDHLQVFAIELGAASNAMHLGIDAVGGACTANADAETTRWMPLSKQPQTTAWMLDLASARAGGSSLWCSDDAGSSCSALLDTGTNFIGVPAPLFATVFADVIAAAGLSAAACNYDLDGLSMPVCDCSAGGAEAFPPLRFEFQELAGDAVTVEVPSAQYVSEITHALWGSRRCTVHMAALPADPADVVKHSWILGTPFLRSQMSIFKFDFFADEVKSDAKSDVSGSDRIDAFRRACNLPRKQAGDSDKGDVSHPRALIGLMPLLRSAATSRSWQTSALAVVHEHMPLSLLVGLVGVSALYAAFRSHWTESR